MALLSVMASPHSSADLIRPQGGIQEDDNETRQKQAALDLRRNWRFDEDQQGGPPQGFSPYTVGSDGAGLWRVAADPQAASAPNVLKQEAPCSGEGCFQLLLADDVTYDYLDLSFKLRPARGVSGGIGGVVFGARDAENFYALLVDFSTDTLILLRMVDGQETLLGRAPIVRKDVPWHHVRVQRNTIISKEIIEAFFDGKLTLSAQDQTHGEGRVGLVTRGASPVDFDNIHAIRIYSQAPFSGPAAY